MAEKILRLDRFNCKVSNDELELLRRMAQVMRRTLSDAAREAWRIQGEDMGLWPLPDASRGKDST
jgi:hypothetical protein